VKSSTITNPSMRREFAAAAAAAAAQFRCEGSSEEYILEQEIAFKVED
jgi:hypothetical protein